MAGGGKDWSPPSDFEEYRLLGPLGAGAMGQVFAAHDTLLDRSVAVKFVTAVPDDAARERFFAEARALARLSHPNVVTVFRVSELRQRPFIVSELVRGRDLTALPRPVAAHQVVKIAVGLARGLGAAHRAGVLHRDIKPANAMVTDDGEVKLIDFGLAKQLELGRALAGPLPRPPAGQPDETMPDQLVGSPLYIAPEIWRGERASRASDIYSLGVLLHELAAGQAPHAGVPIEQLPHAAQLVVPPIAGAVSDCDPVLGAVIDQCLRLDPAQRPTADEVRERLEPLLSAPARGPAAPQDGGGNPYRGLARFDAEHRALFFGRTLEIGSVIERLRAQPLVLVVGDSGVGKSSLCRAGVVPAILDGELDGQAWTSATVLPGSRPCRSLVAAVAPLLGLDPGTALDQLAGDPARLVAALAAAPRPVLVFFDQVEELLTLALPEERAAIDTVLASVVARAVNVKVLGALRSDFVARLAALPQLGPEIARSLYFLPPLGRVGLQQAIVAPAAARGFQFESEDVVARLTEAADHAHGALPLLQFTLAELWDARDREARLLRDDALARLGGVDGALARHADAVVAGLTAAEETAARQILTRLVTPEGTRARLGDSELLLAGSPAERRALDALVRGRLVVASEGEGAEASFELAHEALLTIWSTLRRWLAEDVERQATLRRLALAAKEWERLGRARDALWSGRRLAEARTLDAAALGPRERSFLAAARAARRRRVVALAAAPLLGVIAYGALRLAQARELAREIAARVAEADLASAEAGDLDGEAQRVQARAWTAFDANDWDTGEQLWQRALELRRTVDQREELAGRALESALLRDTSRRELRVRYAETLYQRAVWAERDHRQASADELLARLATYDEAGELRARWLTPASLRLTSEPSGAGVELAAYDTRAGVRSPGPARALGRTPVTDMALAPGSYLITVTAPDRPPLRYPLVVGRGQRTEIALALPARVPEGYVYVPPGRFLFGSADDEDLRRGFLTAAPLHPVITGAFLIARHEVTFADWLAFLRSLPPAERAHRRPHDDQWGQLGLVELPDGDWQLTLQPRDRRYMARIGERIHYADRDRRADQDWLRFPVTGISWEDAVAYTEWLARTGRLPGARLCDDREWERAARGADDRRYPHGDVLAADDINFDETYRRQPQAFGPDEVGSHPRSDSPFGVSDLAGNVWEWTRSPGPQVYTLRGGCWYQDRASSRSNNRSPGDPSTRTIMLGMRVCADLATP